MDVIFNYNTLSKAMIGDGIIKTARTVVNNLYRIIKVTDKYKRLSIILIAMKVKMQVVLEDQPIFESDISTVLKIKRLES